MCITGNHFWSNMQHICRASLFSFTARILATCINRVTHWSIGTGNGSLVMPKFSSRLWSLPWYWLLSVPWCLNSWAFSDSNVLSRDMGTGNLNKMEFYLNCVFWKIFAIEFLLSVLQILCYSKHLIIAASY